MEKPNQPARTPVKVVTTVEYFDDNLNNDNQAGLIVEIIDKSNNKTETKALKEKVGSIIAEQFSADTDFIKIGNSAFFNRRDIISLTATADEDRKIFFFSALFQNGNRERHEIPFAAFGD